MADVLKTLYGFPGPASLPTEEECREVAAAFLPPAAAGFWTPPQHVAARPDPGSRE